ncbi:MAG: hypothetical protein V9E98_11035 [Candidatus Nanopelagicales bacterium]
MRQKLMSIGDDYWIEDENGQRAYKVDGKAVRVRQTPSCSEDAGGQRRRQDPRAQAAGARHHGDRTPGRHHATVKKALVGFARPLHRSRSTAGPELECPRQPRRPRVRDRAGRQYRGDGVQEVVPRTRHLHAGVEIAPGGDAGLILAITVCIDSLTHD